MAAPHWLWGVGAGATAGWYWGDSKTEIAVGALAGSPWGSRVFAHAGRSAFQVTSWASRVAWASGLRHAAWAGARAAGAAATPYVAAAIAPVAVGYGLSLAIGEAMDYDDAGSDYIDFMTLGVSPSEWWNAVTLSSMR